MAILLYRARQKWIGLGVRHNMQISILPSTVAGFWNSHMQDYYNIYT